MTTSSLSLSDHRTIANLYLRLSLAAVGIGIILSLLMRLRVAWPDVSWPLIGTIKPETYLALLTVHGTLMVFFVLTTAPQNVFSNLVLPAQLGSPSMALPALNAAGFWVTLLAMLTLLSSLFVPGGASIAGWTQYPPLSALPQAGPGQGLGTDLWLASISLFCVGAMLSAVNTLVTVLLRRAKGMSFMRMPLTAWAWFITAMLILLAFSVLLAAAALLFSDRHLHTSFFLPAGMVVNGISTSNAGGSPLLWQHLFWFFGHPEVYIAILPAMGIVSHIIPAFARRPIFAYKGMVAAMLAIGVLGFMVWGHHMFTSGMNPYAGLAFSSLTLAIAVPSAVELFNWIATLWGAPLRFRSPLLYCIGFISLFITGGLTGPVLAQPRLDLYLHDTYFVVAHFHLVMGMAVVFAMFAAIHFWAPQLLGTLLDERLAQAHFWLTFFGAYATFFPMHFLGLAGHPRRYAQTAGSAPYLQNLVPVQQFITIASVFTFAAQLIFAFNFVRSCHRRTVCPQNPWQAASLEWAEPAEFDVQKGPYDYRPDGSFVPQWAGAGIQRNEGQSS